MDPAAGITTTGSRVLSEPGITPHCDMPSWDMPSLEKITKVVLAVLGIACLTAAVTFGSIGIAHMAGSLGVSCDVILAPQETRHPENMINWRWRGGLRHSPWYDSVRVYRNLNEWKYERNNR